ncbi:MAG: hypothetical protein ACW980_23300, partial [Promethearchaeota archaeon]
MNLKIILKTLLLFLFTFINLASSAGGTTNITVPEVSFEWVNVDPSTASTATNGTIISDFGDYILRGDDYYLIYEMPFTFNFLERRIINISVNTNGLIELLEIGEDCVECGVYSTHYKGIHISTIDAIFASNDDWHTRNPGDLESEYLGVFNFGNKIVVEWKATTYADSAKPNPPPPSQFQVILFSNGEVMWNFKDMNWRSNTDQGIP